MSTLKTTNIQHPSASTVAITLNSDGTLGNASFANYPGRNRIINGDFSVWQRGTSVTTLGAGSYLADRWCPNQYQTARVQRVANSFSGGPSSQYLARVSSLTTAQAADGSRMVLSQTIESLNSIPLRGKTITLSYWIRFSSTTFSSISNTGESSYGNFQPAIWFMSSTTDASTASTGADQSASPNNIVNGSLPTSWTKYSFTTTVPNNVNNIVVRFGFASRGSTSSADTNWYEISEVQLEEGGVATPYEQKSYAQELRDCQRYYYLHVSGNNQAIASGFNYSATQALGIIHFPVTMRTPPVIVLTSGTNYYAFARNGADDAVNSLSLDSSSTSTYSFSNSTEISGTAGHGGYWLTRNAAASIAFNSEL